jgi:hypothetical protein
MHHFDGTTWNTFEVEGPSDSRRYWEGLWGASCSDIWATGGVTSAPNAYLAHWNGERWTAFEAKAAGAIAGRTADDIWTGAGTTVSHYGSLP